MDAVQMWVRDQYIPAMTGAGRAVRLDATDGREVRLEAADDLTQERRDFEERIATTHCCTDGERAEALKKLERQREQSAWLERFTRERLARENQRHDSSTSGDDSVRRMEWRLRNQWRPDYDASNYDREREKA
jgi:hypothetical protein